MAVFYWLRETYNTGYIAAVKVNEIWGRISDALDPERHYNTPFYYFDLMRDLNFKFWFMFIPIGILLGFFAVEKFKDLTIYTTILCIIFFFIITKSPNRHDWYDMPMYPFLAILVATGIYVMAKMLTNLSVWKGHLRKNTLPYIFLLLPAVPAYGIALTNSLSPDPGEWIVENNSICKYLKDIYHGAISGSEFQLVLDRDYHPKVYNVGNLKMEVKNEYFANIVWYEKVLKDKNIRVTLIDYSEINPFQKVVVSNGHLMARIENDYNFTLKERLYDDRVRVYQLQGRK